MVRDSIAGPTDCRRRLPRRSRAHISLLLVALALWALPCHASQSSVESAAGIIATVDQVTGRYEVRSQELNWTFAGQLGSSTSKVRVVTGRDRLGAYKELQLSWRQQVPLRGTIRTYLDRAIVLFGITYAAPVASAAAVRFPQFTAFPQNLHHFSYRNTEFAPHSFALEQTGTPWLLFDDASHAVVLSPASNFMVASMYGDGIATIASGLNAGLADLPAGFRHTTLMAFGMGVNAAWENWGTALTELEAAHRPANDADVGLRYLGYWTDNGATYYYDYDQKLGYAGTLKALVERYRAEGVPLGYLQLDSWWYFKSLTGPGGEPLQPKNAALPLGEWNRYGGLLAYQAHPALFPRGLAQFQRELQLPLITHNRWIDPESPYHQQFNISGVAAIDPRWWNQIMAYIASANVLTYEQDWLNVIYQSSPALGTTLKAGDAFTDGMAHAAQAKGVSLQYCMPLPRHFLQGSRYGNLTTIRTSGDRLTRSKWDDFLYTSRLASALGIWPWTDVFMSSETDNILLATLSAGMVGIGDRIGSESKENLLRAVRLDGVIIKPDSPLLPIDAAYVADAMGTSASDVMDSQTPMIAAAHTNHGGLRTSYVLAYARSSKATSITITASQVGITHDAYLYDTGARSARRVGASEPFAIDLAPGGTAYYVLVSVARSGIALFGDEGKLVPDGRKRIASLADGQNGVTATVTFAPQESSVRLFGYATRRPRVVAQKGTVSGLTFDEASGRLEVSVTPGPVEVREAPGNNPIRQATVIFQSG
jgi:hypothetical protein